MKLKKYLDKNEHEFGFELLNVIMALQESRDFYTTHHQRKVSDISIKIAEKLGLTGKEIFNIRTSANLRAIGRHFH